MVYVGVPKIWMRWATKFANPLGLGAWLTPRNTRFLTRVNLPKLALLSHLSWSFEVIDNKTVRYGICLSGISELVISSMI